MVCMGGEVESVHIYYVCVRVRVCVCVCVPPTNCIVSAERLNHTLERERERERERENPFVFR